MTFEEICAGIRSEGHQLTAAMVSYEPDGPPRFSTILTLEAPARSAAENVEDDQILAAINYLSAGEDADREMLDRAEWLRLRFGPAVGINRYLFAVVAGPDGIAGCRLHRLLPVTESKARLHLAYQVTTVWSHRRLHRFL